MTPFQKDIGYLVVGLLVFWLGLKTALLFMFIPDMTLLQKFLAACVGGFFMGFSAAKLKRRFEERGW